MKLISKDQLINKSTLLQLTAGLLLSALIVIFYINSNSLSAIEHGEFLDKLGQLNTLDSEVNQKLYETEAGHFPNFDELVDTSTLFQNEFEQVKSVLKEKNIPSIKPIIANYKSLISMKSDLIENFKSHHAVHKNSLNYLPVAIKTFKEKTLKDTNLQPLYEQLHTLLISIQQLHLKRQNRHQFQVNQTLNQLHKISRTSENDIKKSLNIILRHADMVIDYNFELKNILMSIHYLDTRSYINKLRNEYLLHYDELDQQAKKYRSGLLATTAMLAIWLIYTFGRLKRNTQLLSDSLSELNFQKFAVDQHAIVSATDVNGNITYVNDRFCVISQYTEDELIGKNHRIIKSGEHSPSVYTDLWETIASGDVWHGELKNRAKDGSFYWVDSTIVPFIDQHGKPFQYISIRTDITDRKNFEEIISDSNKSLEHEVASRTRELRKLSEAVEQSPVSIMITDKDGFIQYTNPTFSLVTGWTFNEIKDQNTSVLQSDKTPQLKYDSLLSNVNDGQVWNGQSYNLKKNGDTYLQNLTVSPIKGEDNHIQNLLWISEDISIQKEQEERIHHLAHHDSLTGLLNRFSLELRMEQAVALSSRHNSMLAVLFIDLDRFKNVNDTYGHKAGDSLLIQISQRLKAICQRKSDLIARIGGDEFVVVLSEIPAPEFAALTANTLVEALSIPYQFESDELLSSPSIGISLYPSDGLLCEDLLRNADMAMYHVKDSGRGNFRFYEEKMNEKIEERIRLEKALQLAIKDNHLELNYQPQICLSDGRVCGVEALLRWNHPELGFISPEKFIPVAEDSGQIEALGLWVIETALKKLTELVSNGIDHVRIAINVSAKQLDSPSLVPEVKKLLDKYNVNRSLVEFEVTESAAMTDPIRSVKRLVELRALGLELSIDDFGTGYSSLSYLKMLPVQSLKLDKSFVMNIENDNDNKAISRAAISLGHDLGFKVVAEGVETVGQKDFLESINCDMLQGYFFSRPLKANDIEAFIKNYS